MSVGNLFLFIFQIIVSVLLIVVVLLQSSDEDSLSGIGAGAGKGKNLSYKNSADTVSKITIVLGTLLLLNSFVLTSIYTRKYVKNKSIVKDYFVEQQKNEKIENEGKSKTINKK